MAYSVGPPSWWWRCRARRQPEPEPRPRAQVGQVSEHGGPGQGRVAGSGADAGVPVHRSPRAVRASGARPPRTLPRPSREELVGSATPAGSAAWRLELFAGRAGGVTSAAIISSDGRHLAGTTSPEPGAAERVASIAAGVIDLAQ